MAKENVRPWMQSPPSVVRNARAEFHGGDEAWLRVFLRPAGFRRIIVRGMGIKEVGHRGSSMELAVKTMQARALDETEPKLVGEGGVHEPRGSRRRKTCWRRSSYSVAAGATWSLKHLHRRFSNIRALEYSWATCWL
jgi:hypothetical protein